MFSSMHTKFEIKDKTGRMLRMTDWNWRHIIKKHQEISSEKEKITETLEKPDKIALSLKDDMARYYYRHYKERNSPNKFMMVLVKYLNGEGFIISAYFVQKIE